jgi:glycosyltransferase involved in cell wall biosynthesis
MRIVHWDEMFHPLFGYQINILPKFQVQQGHEVIIVTSESIERHPTFSGFGNSTNIKEEDGKYTEKFGVKIIRLPIYGVISGRVIYKKGYINKIKELNPDIVMCHTNDTLSSIRIAQKYKKINVPIVFDNHMLEMASKNPLSKYFRLYFKIFVTPIIKKNKLIVIRTQDDDYVNKHLGIPKELTPFISFGSDTTIFYPNSTKKLEFRKKYNIREDDFVIIYAGKLTEDKGGMLLAQAFKEKFDTRKNIVLIVVGNCRSPYELEVEKAFGESENRIIRFPTQSYVDLPMFYQMADLSVFAKQCSLSFYDVQACALPVILENNNVNVDRLGYNNGYTFEVDNIEDFREKVKKISELDREEYENISSNALNFVRNNYDYEIIAEKYTKVLIDEYNRFHNV